MSSVNRLKMSLEAFICIRFADPVVALTLNKGALVYGSMMGRVLHFQFGTCRERVISEREDEQIRGAWLNENDCLYYAVGDLRGVVVQSPEHPYSPSQIIEPGKVHTVTSCPYTVVVMHEDVMAFIIVDSASPTEQLLPAQHGLYLTKMSTEISDECPKARFPPQSMPFDFDGKRLLWMNWAPDGFRTFRLLELNPFREVVLDTYMKSFGQITHAKLQDQSVIFVRGHRHLVQFYLGNPTKQATFGLHDTDIVAVCISAISPVNIQPPRHVPHFQAGLNVARMESQSHIEEIVEDSLRPSKHRDTVIVSVDEDGIIKVWHDFEEKEVIQISQLIELTQEFRQAHYFSMGYPYLVQCFSPRIAISTDHGVLVIRSRFLEELQSSLFK